MQNLIGTWTLFAKEVRRFTKVYVQTVFTPMLTALLYLLVFAQVLEGRVDVYPNVSYTEFLIPGLMMMSLMQNAFANSSSSLAQSKMNGSLVFLLLAPLSAFEIWLAYISAAIVRGLMVALGIGIVAFIMLPDAIHIHDPLMILLFALGGAAILGVLGIIAGIIADKYEHLSMFQNFIILPLSFLSGVFYSIDQLPEPWDSVSRFNPFFYMIDGFRYGFIGESDVALWQGGIIILLTLTILSLICMRILASGYRVRH